MWSKEYFRLHRMDQYLFLGNLRFVQLQAIYTSVLVTFRHPDDGRLLFSLSISLHCDNLANVLVAMSTVGLLLMTCHAGRFYVFCNLLSWQFLVLFASSLLCLKPRVGLETKSKSSRIGIVFIARSEVWGACSTMFMWAAAPHWPNRCSAVRIHYPAPNSYQLQQVVNTNLPRSAQAQSALPHRGFRLKVWTVYFW